MPGPLTLDEIVERTMKMIDRIMPVLMEEESIEVVDSVLNTLLINFVKTYKGEEAAERLLTAFNKMNPHSEVIDARDRNKRYTNMLQNDPNNDPNLTEELCTARAEELLEQIKPLLGNEDMRVLGTLLATLMLSFVKVHFGEEAYNRLAAAIFGEILNYAPESEQTRYMNMLVDKGYDWPAKIGKAKGKAKKAGK